MSDPNIVSHAPHTAALLSESADASVSAETLLDRARGAMLGLAVGNLLGLPVEGASHHDIAYWYPNGLSDPDPREARSPMDDDLAQAVELGEALARGGDYVSDFCNRLVAWLRENGRGCGSTTYRVISLIEEGMPYPEPARAVYERRRIAPNGGVMRCAPVGAARRRSPERLIGDSAATCAVTHYAPICQWSCIVINAVIALLLSGEEADSTAILAAARADGAPDLRAKAHADGIPSEVFDAVAAGESPPRDASWLRQDQHLIGHTLLAAQAGLWAAATPLSLDEALVDLVAGGGDTDTNAAVAGAVLGARYGAGAIPASWLSCIPERPRIEALADALASMSEPTGA